MQPLLNHLMSFKGKLPKRRSILGVCVVLLVAVVLAVVLRQQQSGVSAKVYTIGWTVSPPFQVRGDDGSPTGLAVDLVREAARRRGIQLRWVFHEGSSETALKNHDVDLWGFMSITPERLKSVYITEPFMVTEHCLLVRADSRYRKVQDLAAATIESSGATVDYESLHNRLPGAHIQVQQNTRAMFNEVCANRADAVFTDAYAGINGLLEQTGDCTGHSLRWIPAPQIRIGLGIGATRESRAAADALRQEIGMMSREGALPAILGQWSYMSSQQMEAMEALLDARERSVRLTVAVLGFGLLLAIACWLWIRASRERSKASQAELALRGTEQRLRLMANNLREMVLALDMNRRLIYANPAVLTVSGYTADELARFAVIDWFHPDDRDRMLAVREELYRGGAYQQLEYRLITKSGAVKWVSANWDPVLDENGRQIATQGSVRDITERRGAEEALRESERRFRELLENVQIVAAICDKSGRFTFCNDYFLSVTGWSREEMIGHSCADFVVPQVREQVDKFIEEWSRTGTPVTWVDEPVVMTKAGKRRWLQANSVSLRDASGQITGFASLAVDVTEYRALQEQYLQAQKLEGIGRLAGGIAHDFNNLLTVINGYSQTVLSAMHETDPQRERMVQVRYAGQRAAELTKQLLTFSRKEIAQPVVLNVNELVRESATIFRTLLGEHIRFATMLDGAAPFVIADPSQIHQVLMNLVVNARDAMPGGGTLSLAISEMEVGAESASRPANFPRELSPGPFVVITVADTGSGMTNETKEHIFEPFFSTKGTEGTGLGLSTVYGIVQQNHGAIQVWSEPGEGTSFDVYLPRVQLPVLAALPVTPTAEATGAATILVLEDQDNVRGFACLVLESSGYRVLQASTGEEALSLARTHSGHIDLLLSDVVLPGINGREVAQAFRLVHPETGVLFTSGYTSDEVARRGVTEGSFAFLQKPYSAEALESKVAETLRG